MSTIENKLCGGALLWKIVRGFGISFVTLNVTIISAMAECSSKIAVCDGAFSVLYHETVLLEMYL